MKVYAFLPAKGNSERVESKNYRYLAGERLYIHGLKKLLQCKEIDKVFLDTDSMKMHEESQYLDCEHMVRKPELANNATDGHRLFLNEVENYPDADIYVQYLCTSPFLRPETIDYAIRYLKEHPENDSVIFMKREKVYQWNERNTPEYDIDHIPNSKDLPYSITEGMALYVIRKEAAIALRRRFGNSPHFVYGSPLEYIDINNPEDFEAAEIIANGYAEKENKHLKLLRHFISSPMLSDVLDDLRAEKNIVAGGVIGGLRPNIEGSVIFGRAKTLALRALKPYEDFNGIYKVLESYQSITSNDIIVVENELKEFAYFGDLNTRLAIRAGASGVIVDSATRDVERVRLFNLPVFARNRNAADVRRRATVKSINQEIHIDGVSVCPGDYIFADGDAVVVIKERYYSQIEKILLEKIKCETNVVLGIVEEQSTSQLLKNNGGF